MARIYLVRHGKAAASFTDDADPGLDVEGHEQAKQACELLTRHTPLELLSSPLKRAQETAIPLAEKLSQSVAIETRVAEIPSPGLSLQERGPWLGKIMQENWSQQTQALQDWRASLGQALIDIQQDTAIFSHYVAINAAVGFAEGKDQVMVFRPNNASITVFETDGQSLTLVSRGDEAETKVN